MPAEPIPASVEMQTTWIQPVTEVVVFSNDFARFGDQVERADASDGARVVPGMHGQVGRPAASS